MANIRNTTSGNGPSNPLPSTDRVVTPSDVAPASAPLGAATVINTPDPGTIQSALTGPRTQPDVLNPGANFHRDARGDDESSYALSAAERAAYKRTSFAEWDNEANGSHLIVRSRPEKFNRANFQFDRNWKKLAIDDLSPNQLNAILAEPLLESRRVGEAQADAYVTGVETQVGGQVAVSRALLLDENASLKRELRIAREEIGRLHRQLDGADKAPATGTLVGSSDTNPLPTPSQPQR